MTQNDRSPLTLRIIGQGSQRFAGQLVLPRVLSSAHGLLDVFAYGRSRKSKKSSILLPNPDNEFQSPQLVHMHRKDFQQQRQAHHGSPFCLDRGTSHSDIVPLVVRSFVVCTYTLRGIHATTQCPGRSSEAKSLFFVFQPRRQCQFGYEASIVNCRSERMNIRLHRYSHSTFHKE